MENEDDIRLYPVAGWDFGVLPAGEVAMYLVWLPGVPGARMTTEDVRRAEQVHRYQISAEQCDELAQALSTFAEQSRTRRGAAN